MTAQIVILNKFCAAVASDSSVTLSTPDGQRRSFPTAEKILPLPPAHNIVVVHSGSTELLGVPYSVLLGEWMRTLRDVPLDAVSDYSKHLVAWVEAQKDLFTADAQERYLSWMLRDYLLSVRAEILRRCKEAGIDEKAWSSPRAATVLADAISARLEALASRPKLPNWAKVDGATVLDAHSTTWDESREWVFDDTPRTAEGDAGLAEVAARLMGVYEPFERDATLVFVGFGGMELFPAAESIVLQGIVDGQLRLGQPESTTVTLEMSSSIMPFGQTEAVHTFLRAYNRAFLGTAHDGLERLADAVKNLPDAGAPLLGQLDRVVADAHEALESDFETLSWEQFLQPMVDTVAGLPPAEIARMAESLVGLQVLRQLTQAETETVGGPIDVAIMTRSSGLSWVRHKQLASISTERFASSPP